MGKTTPTDELVMDINDVSKKVKLTWEPARGATGYKIYFGAAGEAVSHLIKIIGGTGSIEPGSIFVSKYPEVNFLLLGIPTSF